jgi:hypothetical protein
MTNIFKGQYKFDTKKALFRLAVSCLEGEGWRVERIPGAGKSSVRRIVKGVHSKVISIRTSQDTWIAFPRNEDNNGWATLDEVDSVIAASVDDPQNPRFAQIHMVSGAEMRDRFDRAYQARKAAGHSLPAGRGMWVSLYHDESSYPVNRVGAGAGLASPPIARIAMKDLMDRQEKSFDEIPSEVGISPAMEPTEPLHLTIANAKRLLALSYGVEEADVRITISG